MRLIRLMIVSMTNSPPNPSSSDCHGWIVLDKPVGISSAKAVAIVRKAFKGMKTGHAGTLDPLASGVLPIALGEATKTISYVMTAQKSYEFSLVWGAETQTDDTEGEVTQRSDIRPSEADILAALPAFTGLIQQIPPDYSAVKVAGQRAYAVARNADKNNQEGSAKLALAARDIQIDSFDLLSCDAESARFHVVCGKGSYIRSLARDLGRALGTAAHVTALRRLSVGKFSVADAISLDLLDKVGHCASAYSYITSILTVLDDIPAVALNEVQARKLRFGQVVLLTEAQISPIVCLGSRDDSEAVIAVFNDHPVALVKLDGMQISPIRVLNL